MNGDSLLRSSILKSGHGAGAPGPDTCIIHSRPTGEEEAQIFGTGDTTGGERGPWTGAADDRLLQPGLLLSPFAWLQFRLLQDFSKAVFVACLALPYVATWGTRRSRAGVVFGRSPAQGSPNLTKPLLPSRSVSFTLGMVYSPLTNPNLSTLKSVLLFNSRLYLSTVASCLTPVFIYPPTPPPPIKVITGTWGAGLQTAAFGHNFNIFIVPSLCPTALGRLLWQYNSIL